MSKNASYWISKLNLSRHVEGGSFRETYRSPINIPSAVLPKGFAGDTSVSTCIYFLLEQGQFSAFHKINSDECWHFYEGSQLDIFEIDAKGILTVHKLGRDLEAGESFQVVIKAGNWFASRVAFGGDYALVGCTVAPGFDFADFELATSGSLSSKYPHHASLIKTLTYS
ncbi:MAG: cupin domain-containing protein [Flavitalea sp.]